MNIIILYIIYAIILFLSYFDIYIYTIDNSHKYMETRMSFRKHATGGDSAIYEQVFFFFFSSRRPYGLWTESGRIGMLHKRGNCVSGNWQLPKSDGGSGVDNSARARARDFADRRKNRREYEWGCARKFRMDHRTSNTLVINLRILQRHLPRLRPQHRIGSDRIGIAIIMQSAVRPIHREKEREAFF